MLKKNSITMRAISVLITVCLVLSSGPVASPVPDQQTNPYSDKLDKIKSYRSYALGRTAEAQAAWAKLTTEDKQKYLALFSNLTKPEFQRVAAQILKPKTGAMTNTYKTAKGVELRINSDFEVVPSTFTKFSGSSRGRISGIERKSNPGLGKAFDWMGLGLTEAWS